MYFMDSASDFCDTLLPIVKLVKHGVIPVIQLGIPIILIIIGMIDLGKAVIASKEDEIKTAQKLLIKRAIYAVAIFFVVLIVTAVFNLVGSSSGQNTATWSTCWQQAG